MDLITEPMGATEDLRSACISPALTELPIQEGTGICDYPLTLANANFKMKVTGAATFVELSHMTLCKADPLLFLSHVP